MNEEYGLGDLMVGQLGPDRHSLFIRSQGRVLLETPTVLKALLRTRRIDTLEGHARYLADEHKLGANSVPALVEELSGLVDSGVLVSKVQLLGLPGERPAGHDLAVNTLAVPTRARPDAVERCVGSFARSALREGRSLKVLVVDSTPERTQSNATRESLMSLQRSMGFSMLLATTQDLARFALDLARAADVSEAVTRFCLFDVHEVGGCDTGANRNALLLGSSGSAILMTDDDTLADVRKGSGPADPAGAELVISGSADPSKMEIYRDELDARRAPLQPEVSLLQRCEGLLGRSVADIAAGFPFEKIRFEEMRPGLVRRLLAGRAKVGVVAPGIWGDSGVRFPGFYLWNRPELRDALARDAPAYAALSRSRQMIRQVAAPTLTGPCFLMSTCLGLDNRGLLPPFLPVGRGQDIVFGTILRLISRDLMVSHLPEAVTHCPTDGRQLTVQPLWDPASRLELAPLVDAMFGLVSPGLEVASSEEGRLRLMAAHLQELTAQPWPEIDRLLKEELWQRLARRMVYWESLARSCPAESPWRRDLLHFQTHLLEQAQRGGPALPQRLLVGRDEKEAASILRAFMVDLGKLLSAWPALMGAARQLRREGRGLFGPEG
jgi:hypothetical protein